MHRTLSIAILVIGVACSPDDEPKKQAPSTPEDTISYLRDIQPIIERSCNSCHRNGGLAPFTFDTPEKVINYAAAIKASVVSRRMPPFMASTDCNTYKHDTRLSDEEIALISDWADKGAPKGDPADEKHASNPIVGSIRHDAVMDLGGDFDASLMQDDNYRCFILDPKLTRDMDITGVEVIPTNDRIAHHAVAYILSDENRAALEIRDANDPGPGSDCYTDLGLTGVSLLNNWGPGQGPAIMPPGSGLHIKAGQKLLFQIHYNLLNAGEKPPIDNTSLVLQLQEPGIAKRAESNFILRNDLDIPANTKDVVQKQTNTITMEEDGMQIHTAFGHMHQFGQSMSLRVIRADGSKECLLDIPRWDFDWQQQFELEIPVTIAAGDKIELECVYDNTQANQPIIGGQQVTSKPVKDGKGSLDEMCVAVFYTTYPD